MQITIKIPERIIQLCKECGWDEEQTKKVFIEYLGDIFENPYNHFEIDFDNWVNDEDNQEFLENL
jgi:hypothetical protein